MRDTGVDVELSSQRRWRAGVGEAVVREKRETRRVAVERKTEESMVGACLGAFFGWMEIGVVDGCRVVAGCETWNVEMGKNGAAGGRWMEIAGQAGDVVVPLYVQLPQTSTRHKSPSTSLRTIAPVSHVCTPVRTVRISPSIGLPLHQPHRELARSGAAKRTATLCGRRSVARQVRGEVCGRSTGAEQGIVSTAGRGEMQEDATSGGEGQDQTTLTLERYERRPKIALGLSGAGKGMDLGGVGRGA